MGDHGDDYSREDTRENRGRYEESGNNDGNRESQSQGMNTIYVASLAFEVRFQH